MSNADWTQAQCSACGMFSTWRGNHLVYPAASTVAVPHEDMPDDVVLLYNEARAVVGVSRRAGAAMARSTLEVLLRQVLPDATSRLRLVDLIDLADAKVSSGLGDLLTYVRHVGNSAVHVDEVPDDTTVLVLDRSTTEAVDAIFTAINGVVDEFVTKPKQTARFAALIPESVQKDVDARRAKRDQHQ